MKANSTFKIILTSLFAALICVATMLIRIPTPVTNGYANLGDGVILLCAFLFTPGYAVAAAAIGSMLADVLAGYMAYAPGTLLVKGLVALIAALIARRFSGAQEGRKLFLVRLTAGIIAELFMVLGYFLYESLILSYGVGAAASIPANLCQGAVGVIVALVLTPVLTRSHEINEMLHKLR